MPFCCGEGLHCGITEEDGKPVCVSDDDTADDCEGECSNEPIEELFSTIIQYKMILLFFICFIFVF